MHASPALSEKIDVLDVEASMKDLLNLMWRTKRHRIIVSKDGAPYQLLSHMDVVRYMDKHSGLIPETARNSPVKSFMSTSPVTVRTDGMSPLCLVFVIISFATQRG